MRRRSTWCTGVAALALSAGSLAVATAGPAAAATPTETGCPAGFLLLSLEFLKPLGYQVPFRLDAEGNNDGYVCGKPVVDAAAEQYCGAPCGFVLYNFYDNGLTPAH